MKNIMVIDDIPDTLATLFELLSSEGYKVTTAISGEEALPIVERSKPDLIICDLAMPGLDGMEVLARIRRMAPDVKFVFLTAYGTPESYVQGLDLGARDMLLKPFKNEELLRVVRHLLDGGVAA